MTSGQEPANGASASCLCCGRRVYRMHGLVVLVRQPKHAVSMRLTCVGYCAEHREEALDAALEPFRGRGQVVVVSAPELVRPSRQLQWRRATTSRLAQAAQLLLASSDAVGEPLPYPLEPASSVEPAYPVEPVGDTKPVFRAPSGASNDIAL